MRAAIIVVLAVAVAFFVAWRADAHTLTMAGAARVADRYADTVRSARIDLCRRESVHAVDCLAIFERSATGRQCRAVIRVRFPGRDRDVSRRILSVRCSAD